MLRGDTSTWEDRFFYLEVIRKYGEPVLDVGCGTGRLLLDFLAQGIEIEGVDNSPDMLAVCRQKASALGLQPTLYEQYLENLSLPHLYRTILIPSSTLQLIIEPSMVKQALQKVYDQLLPGGVVSASIMGLWQEGEPLHQSWEKSAVRTGDGATFRREVTNRYEPEKEIEHTQDLYQLIVDGQVVAEELHQRSPATRSYNQAQARNLFDGIGFASVTLYSGFTFEQVKPEDNLFTVLAQKTA